MKDVYYKFNTYDDRLTISLYFDEEEATRLNNETIEVIKKGVNEFIHLYNYKCKFNVKPYYVALIDLYKESNMELLEFYISTKIRNFVLNELHKINESNTKLVEILCRYLIDEFNKDYLELPVLLIKDIDYIKIASK